MQYLFLLIILAFKMLSGCLAGVTFVHGIQRRRLFLQMWHIQNLILVPQGNAVDRLLLGTGSSSLGRTLASSVQPKFPSVADQSDGHITTDSEWDKSTNMKLRVAEGPRRNEAAWTGKVIKQSDAIKSFSDLF